MHRRALALAVCAVATAFGENSSCRLCGTWQGSTHGQPSLIITVTNQQRQPAGSITFTLQHLENGRWTAVGQNKTELLSPKWAGPNLDFEVAHAKEHGGSERGPNVKFRLEPKGADGAVLIRVHDNESFVLSRTK